MDNYFIIHGTEENPNENWFPWLSEKLIKQGKNVIVPCFPIKQGQNYENWEKLLKYYASLNLINENTVFICHSVAATFISKFLIRNKIEAKALITVAGFNAPLGQDTEQINKTFLMDDGEISKVGKQVKYVYCFYSDNDPYVSRDELEKFIFEVNGSKALISGAAHFGKEVNYKEFPEMLDAIDKMEKTAFKKELL